jgi:hypothetical protein
MQIQFLMSGIAGYRHGKVAKNKTTKNKKERKKKRSKNTENFPKTQPPKN